MIERRGERTTVRRRMTASFAAFVMSAGVVACANERVPQSEAAEQCTYAHDGEHISISPEEVLRCLGTLAIKADAPMTGYDRYKKFGRWRQKDECTTRESILIRDFSSEVVNKEKCEIISGTFNDAYTDERDVKIPGDIKLSSIEIDHVVALGDAWKSGASQLPQKDRIDLANDPLNLQATESKNNRQKSDDDAARWTPPSDGEVCRYVARQVLVKQRYHLWMDAAEHKKIKDSLTLCPDALLNLPE